MTVTALDELMSGVRVDQLELPISISVRSTGATAGAIVEGVDLASDVPGDVIAALVRIFNHAGVTILPGQDRLTPERQIEVTEWFGRPYARGLVGFGDGADRIASVNNGPVQILGNIDARIRGSDKPVMERDAKGEAYSIHSDVQDYPVVPDLTMLHGFQVPPAHAGGSTYFYDLYAAFDALEASLRDRLVGCRWRARTTYEMGVYVHTFEDVDDPKGPSPVRHPVVRTHPVTRRRALWISPDFTKEIVGLGDPSEAEALRQQLLAHVADERFAYRHVWSPHDVLMWDNRCVNHRRDAYDIRFVREMHRTQAGGAVPF